MAYDMVNMKQKKGEESMLAEPVQSDYPYGLKITLEAESLKKLGIKTLPDIGQYFMLYGACEVCALSQYDSKDHKDRSLTLQITDMALETKRTKQEPDKALYGK